MNNNEHSCALTTLEIETDGPATIHVRPGSDGHAVVLLHGFGTRADIWAPLTAAFSKMIPPAGSTK
jgi:hypothetical protein